MKSVYLARQARLDLQDALDYYDDIDSSLGGRFVQAVEATKVHIGRFPGMGFPRYGQMLQIPDLRYWMLKGFPYSVFYLDYPSHIDVIRVLHQSADIPRLLQENPTL